MVKIRLSRFGRKKLPFYRIVVCDSRSPRDGKFIDKIGFYDPINNNVKIDILKVNKWIKNGAKMSNIVLNIYKKYIINSSK
ncbi:30S ribosomal protein S16 [Candidatus Nardonella dryophthoridicola]|uniref:Small ribosomal subunit protein bS16 n=1 Tax=endosymbiont of Rhynchophorus ferrugineus TaxID=1972133 RepID=A0A2Z5T420_9GAMM|nr:30S ribosomal protein S16 [Candidatus Nardonella dryophthoridicola]QTJ62891.1 30S ribosomal protein S16 [Candidatus Nardonella dryophthoridicola]BBA85137.1 30S ribosomal protein S16 [endosymbiont of Rhynchophorus ferrugineus]